MDEEVIGIMIDNLLREIRLSVKWPCVNEDMIVENDVYSDLDPLSAPYWALSVEFQTGIECMMSTLLLLGLGGELSNGRGYGVMLAI